MPNMQKSSLPGGVGLPLSVLRLARDGGEIGADEFREEPGICVAAAKFSPRWRARYRGVQLLLFACWLACVLPVGAQTAVTNRATGRTHEGLTDTAKLNRLIEDLANWSPLVRRHAAEELGDSGDTRAVEPLVKAFQDRDGTVRRKAAEALGKLGDTRAVTAELTRLIENLANSSPEVRRHAAEQLGDFGDARAVEPLIKALQDKDYPVRWKATEALGKLGDARAVELLIRILGNEDANSRYWAAEALDKLGDARAVEPLAQALRDKNEIVRAEATDALVHRLVSVGAAEWETELAGGANLPARFLVGSYFVREPNPLTWGFLSACLRAVFSWPSLGYSGVLALALALPGWFWFRKLRKPGPRIGVWLAWGFAWVEVMYGLAYGDDCIGPTLAIGLASGFVGWFRPQAGEDLSTRLVHWCLWIVVLVFLVFGLLRIGPFAVVVMFVMVLGLSLPKWWPWWVRRSRQVVPGTGGWLVLGWVWVALLLYGVILRWTRGSVVFLTVAMIPAWIVGLVGIGMGLVLWPKTRQRVASFVCRDDFHRFAPGSRLGWMARWSGCWLWREKDAPMDMADSCVCRVCGKSSRYEGVEEVVGVLDNHGGCYPQQTEAVLRVNWLAKKLPFDFGRVELVEATDTEVEEFIRQIRYQADLRIQRRLPKMTCTVNAECHFQRENTMTLLRQTFGSVTKD